ncbi:(2Fe-2S)-binding protein [Pelomonas sp. APW6]|jgi:bacterioferritin-associated ferredoxin|uniref:Bacterioferritin-associated ferredoxin n=1 Tax=Roseateles subflavus TaxID=3053353 RepID=A0ABT7LJ95_9BURK|nr:(2Fe-2S)-binding protein [Pelomonas sp. APW6]MDL5032932.1 (2Fe-2S)-binding protein [Pelomonas sp. APW6]
MIVCLCHRVSDRDIRRAVAEGTSNFDVLQDDTRVASACGACQDCAREVFDEALAKQGSVPAVMAAPLAQTRRVIRLATA